jgi:tetratricopeptide (TPR) repeat protein
MMSKDFEQIVDQARSDRRVGRLREALTCYESAADLARSANDLGKLAHAQRHVGELQLELGQNHAAEFAAAEAVALCRLHDAASLNLANAQRVMPLVEESLGHSSAATGSWREARSLYEAAGVRPGVHEFDQHVA